MAKVTYFGTSMRHSTNPTGTEYMFHQGEPTEVKSEDAKHYALKEERGAPWRVDLGVVEKANTIIQEVTEELKKEKEKPRRYGGKK